MTDTLFVSKPGGVPDAHVFDPFGNDKHALEEWISSKHAGSAHTIRAYKQAVLALRSWLCARQGGDQVDILLKMTAIEANAYVASLFQQSDLKVSSIKHRVVILSSLYDYWMTPRDGGKTIVASNPFFGLSKTLKSDSRPNIGSQRALNPQEVAQIRHAIDDLKSTKHYHRTLLIWLLSSRLALRRSEIAGLRANNFSLSSSSRRWVLRINGKGRNAGDDPDLVVVPDEVMDCIGAYRESIGLHRFPLPSEPGPLLRRLATETSSRRTDFMTPEHVARIMKTVFRIAADDAAKRLQDPVMEQRLLQASSHWGRHTWFVNALKKHPIHLVSLGGRHKDIRTTQRAYVSLSEDDLAKLAD